MGFKEPSKVFVLQFEGELDGLEIKAKGASVQQILGLLNLASLGQGVKLENVKDLDELFSLFASRLVSWNLEDEDGEPLTFEPMDVDVIDMVTGVVSKVRETPKEAKVRVLTGRALDLVMSMIFAWLDAVIGTTGPKEAPSSDGALSLVESLQMDQL